VRFYRIGDKVVSREKVDEVVSAILEAREGGATQEEAARDFGVQRTFVSFLETLGEVRRGKRVAVIGFPIENVDEVKAVCDSHAVEFCLVFSQEEREGLEAGPADRMFNLVLETLAELTAFDVIVLLASDRRVKPVERILGREVVGISLGPSPLRHDVRVDTTELDALLAGITAEGEQPARRTRDALKKAVEGAGRWQRSKKSSASA
jgi:hypothetical protein